VRWSIGIAASIGDAAQACRGEGGQHNGSSAGGIVLMLVCGMGWGCVSLLGGEGARSQL
jgi:hypothetical protein